VPRRLLVALLPLVACATAPPAPSPAPPRAEARPAPPALPPTEAARLDEAARLLADGAGLERAALLLAAVAPGPSRRDLLLGQLAELRGDDVTAVAAYELVLARGEDDEVRLRRALALERLGLGAEAADDLRRLRPAPREPALQPAPTRQLRPLRPSSR